MRLNCALRRSPHDIPPPHAHTFPVFFPLFFPQLTDAQEKMMLRIGKVFIRNMKNNRMFGSKVSNATDMFRAIDRDGSGAATSTSF